MKKARFVSSQTRLNLIFTLLFLVAVIILTGFIKTCTNAMAYNAEARITFIQAREFFQTKVYLQQFERTLNDYELTPEYDILSEYYSSYARLQQSLANTTAKAGLPEEKASLDSLIQDIATLRQRFDQVIPAVPQHIPARIGEGMASDISQSLSVQLIPFDRSLRTEDPACLLGTAELLHLEPGLLEKDSSQRQEVAHVQDITTGEDMQPSAVIVADLGHAAVWFQQMQDRLEHPVQPVCVGVSEYCPGGIAVVGAVA